LKNIYYEAPYYAIIIYLTLYVLCGSLPSGSPSPSQKTDCLPSLVTLLLIVSWNNKLKLFKHYNHYCIFSSTAITTDFNTHCCLCPFLNECNEDENNKDVHAQVLCIKDSQLLPSEHNERGKNKVKQLLSSQ